MAPALGGALQIAPFATGFAIGSLRATSSLDGDGPPEIALTGNPPELDAASSAATVPRGVGEEATRAPPEADALDATEVTVPTSIGLLSLPLSATFAGYSWT